MNPIDQLHRAEAAARNWAQLQQTLRPESLPEGDRLLIDLLAALDAARGEAVATVRTDTFSKTAAHEFGFTRIEFNVDVPPKDGTKLFAAPPAALAVQFNGMTDDETSATASVMGLSKPAADESLADTKRAIIEAAERRGYERGLKEAPPAAPCDACRVSPAGCLHLEEGQPVRHVDCAKIGCLRLAPPAAAVPASDPPVMELIGKYWDLGFTEGKTGVNQADAANELLHQIRRALAQQPAAAVPEGSPVATRFRLMPTDASPGCGWIYEDGDTAAALIGKPYPGLEVQSLRANTVWPPAASPSKGVVTKIGGKDDASGCYRVVIGEKEYVRHGEHYAAFFEARDPRTGLIHRRSRTLSELKIKARIDAAIEPVLAAANKENNNGNS